MAFPLVPLLSTFIPAAANFVSSMVSNRNQRKEYREMREWNTPASQMQRFKDAGLSPYLAYGQASSGNVSSPMPAREFPIDKLAAQDVLGQYMSFANFDIENRNKWMDYWNAKYDNNLLHIKNDMEEVKRQRQLAEFYADFPEALKRFETEITPEVVNSSFKMKMNELKKEASKVAIDRLKVAMEGMKSKNVVDAVKAKYADEFGMVGGDWTQGLGLIKSLPSFFKRGAKNVNPQHKALIQSYEKFKGDQYKRNANRFLFEQLKP